MIGRYATREEGEGGNYNIFLENALYIYLGLNLSTRSQKPAKASKNS
jgi:hypothetical protein